MLVRLESKTNFTIQRNWLKKVGLKKKGLPVIYISKPLI